ncbi:MAG: tRNA glutamyl-Q(34) synthetase GluQRS [Rhodospirillaceae bacterium]|nr:tRNA glutamyl-Q(34) synthetase GluQRS [Rhodospirillaceae bacterium]
MTASKNTGAAIVTRFAPSPTGYLHLGHAHSALDAWRRARHAHGRFLLRIEDIDPTRCRPEFVAALFEDLAWLGLDWELPVRRQSTHFDDYRLALDRLRAMDLLYPCFCSRKDIAAAAAAPHGPDGPLYPGTCRHLPTEVAVARQQAGEPFALRLDIARASEMAGPLTFEEERLGRVIVASRQFGDVVLARRETPSSYHLCVTVDDHLQGVTLVTRGEDLLPATHIHRLLQALLGLNEPRYAHHRLLTDSTGRRLAKRDAAATLRSLREAGQSPTEVRALAGFLD